jgi:hypothetical protein
MELQQNPFFEDSRKTKLEASPINCELCRTRFNSRDAYNEHLESEKHIKRVRYLDMLDSEELKEKSTNSSPGFISETSSSYNLNDIPVSESTKKCLVSDWCHCCYIRYTSESHMIQHLSGKDHLKRLKFNEMGGVAPEEANGYFCSLCVANNSSEINHKVHMSSLNHLAQVNKFEEYNKHVQNPLANSFSPVKLGMSKSKSMMSFQSPTTKNQKSERPEKKQAIEFENKLELDSQSSFELLESKNCDIYDKFNIKVYKFRPSENEISKRVKSNLQSSHDETEKIKLNLYETLFTNMIENFNFINSVFNSEE